MREAIDASQPAPALGATSLILAVWLLGASVALGAGTLVAAFSQPEQWQRYNIDAAGFTAEYPHAPATFTRRERTPLGEVDSWRVMAAQDMLQKFTVQFYEVPKPLAA